MASLILTHLHGTLRGSRVEGWTPHKPTSILVGELPIGSTHQSHLEGIKKGNTEPGLSGCRSGLLTLSVQSSTERLGYCKTFECWIWKQIVSDIYNEWWNGCLTRSFFTCLDSNSQAQHRLRVHKDRNRCFEGFGIMTLYPLETQVDLPSFPPATILDPQKWLRGPGYAQCTAADPPFHSILPGSNP